MKRAFPSVHPGSAAAVAHARLSPPPVKNVGLERPAVGHPADDAFRHQLVAFAVVPW